MASSGSWRVVSAVHDGRAICLVQSAIGDRLLAFSVAANEPAMAVRAAKLSWLIPATPNTVPVTISFDGGPAWPTVYATALTGGQAVAVGISPPAARAFVHGVTASGMITVSFGGNEAPWTFNLAGTTGAWPAFMDCAKRVNPDVVAQLAPPVATQPFAQAPATRPYAVAPPLPHPYVAPAPGRPYVSTGSGLQI